MQRIFHSIAWLAVVGIVFPIWANSAENDSPPSLSSDYPAGLSKEEIYKHANDFYLDNQPEKALEGYLDLYDIGVRNGHLNYNIGNAYFRLGQLGKSILWYERALQWLPRFHDLRVNYEYARGLLADEEFRGPEYGGTLGFLIGVHRKLNLRESLWTTVFLFWILSGLFIMRLLLPAARRGAWLSIPCWIVSIAFILLCLSSALRIYQYEYIKEAVVMASAVEIKTGPGDDFSTSFSLHEGTKVRWVQEQGDWVRILLPGNASFTGWMPESAVEAI
ncbi:MAG: hypothetical protein JXR73_22960 [Candidatus Omnitrophica bacterium]|nr:hypothetical protein [Candidatus Omnitrophota bacterium]